jgi:DNA-binding MarR family transcriptional regulator
MATELNTLTASRHDRLRPAARRSAARPRIRAAQSRTLLERQALLCARALVDQMRSYYRELEQLTGTPIGMHRALNAIGASPGLQASHLAVTLGMQRPAISQVLKGLVERGWVERVRVESDQRAVLLFLTSGGGKMLQATAGRAVGMLQRAINSLSDRHVQQLADALPVLLQRLPARPGQRPRTRNSP